VRIVAIGSSEATEVVDELVEAGHEVHSVDVIRPSVRWLASHTDVDLGDSAALLGAIGRIGAIVDEVHLFVAVDADLVAAITAAVGLLGIDETSVAVVAHYV
jgi:hypothetical protein